LEAILLKDKIILSTEEGFYTIPVHDGYYHDVRDRIVGDLIIEMYEKNPFVNYTTGKAAKYSTRIRTALSTAIGTALYAIYSPQERQFSKELRYTYKCNIPQNFAVQQLRHNKYFFSDITKYTAATWAAQLKLSNMEELANKIKVIGLPDNYDEKKYIKRFFSYLGKKFSKWNTISLNVSNNLSLPFVNPSSWSWTEMVWQSTFLSVSSSPNRFDQLDLLAHPLFSEGKHGLISLSKEMRGTNMFRGKQPKIAEQFFRYIEEMTAIDNVPHEIPQLTTPLTLFRWAKEIHDRPVLRNPRPKITGPVPIPEWAKFVKLSGLSLITTAEDLEREGEDMHHCVGLYSNRCKNYVHFDYQEKDLRITLQTDWDGNYIQSSSFCNRRDEETEKASGVVMQAIRKGISIYIHNITRNAPYNGTFNYITAPEIIYTVV
jgi:hypothetical protein